MLFLLHCQSFLQSLRHVIGSSYIFYRRCIINIDVKRKESRERERERREEMTAGKEAHQESDMRQSHHI